MKLQHRQTLRAMFAWPAAIGAATVVGLVSGLMGNGVADGIAWIGLAVPILIAAAYLRKARET